MHILREISCDSANRLMAGNGGRQMLRAHKTRSLKNFAAPEFSSK
jgi:hypothetical protein